MIRGIETAKKSGAFLITVALCGGLTAAALFVCDSTLAAQTSGAKLKLRVALLHKQVFATSLCKWRLT